MSERGKKPSDRRVEICDFQAKHLVSPEREEAYLIGKTSAEKMDNAGVIW